MLKRTLVKVFAPLVLLTATYANADDFTITFDEPGLDSNSCWGAACPGRTNLSDIVDKEYQKGGFGDKAAHKNRGFYFGNDNEGVDVRFWAQTSEQGNQSKTVDFDNGKRPVHVKNANAWLTLFNSDLESSAIKNGGIDDDLLVGKGNIAIIHERNNECSAANGTNNKCENPDDRFDSHFSGGNSSSPVNPTGLPSGGFVFVQFSKPVSLHSIDLADIEGSNQQRGSFRFYNGNTTVLNASQTWTPMNVTGNKGYTTQQFSLADSITTLVIRMQGSGGFKNIAFSADVPEPSTLAIFALALFGLAWQRKKA